MTEVNLNLKCTSAEITPDSHVSVVVTLENTTLQDIIDEIGLDRIIDEVGSYEVLKHIDTNDVFDNLDKNDCMNYFDLVEES